MMIVERHERIMARATMKNDDIFFIEPCNNWEGCHVWKHYIAKDIFRQETDVQDSENEVNKGVPNMILVEDTCFLNLRK